MTDLSSADARFARCVAVVCSKAVEGGFVNDPQDPGGPTNHGITIATLTHWRGRPCTVDDVRNLTLAEASTIYRALYWSPVAGDQLPAGLDLICFDSSVNQGPGTAARFLQTALGVAADGHVGPITIAAIDLSELSMEIVAVHDARLRSYKSDAGWGHDGNGWEARLDMIESTSLAWAAGR